MDALDFSKEIVANLGSNGFAFYDPPYIENGKDLYLNDYTIDGHRELAKEVITLKTPWIVTYDYSAVRHKLYARHRRIAYGLQYSANGRHEGKEVLFLSKGLKLPVNWSPGTPILMSREGRRTASVYGIIESTKPHPDKRPNRRTSSRG
jgi:DNA adenine methylase